MKHKKELAFNKSFFLFCFIGALILSLGIYLLIDNISASRAGILLSGLFLLIGGMIKEPLCYGFDEDGIALYFVFLPKEAYLWKNIRRIKNTKKYSASSPILAFIFSNIYEINGKVEGKQYFYMQGEVSKSLRTKKLFEKYCNKKIEK